MSNVTVKTLLKKVQPIKGFCFREVWLEEEVVLARIEPRKGSRARCSGCRRSAPLYDRLKERHFRFVPLWNLVTYFVYTPRRVECRRCGVKVELLPWATGKHALCDGLRLLLAQWARLISWQEVADRFAVGWHSVYESVRWVVDYGLEHRDLSGIEAIGVDEIHVRRKGKVFWTLVYQIDQGMHRLLWVGADRTKATFRGFFDQMGPEVCASIRFVCSDMWKAYLAVVKERLGKGVLHVIDRFHVTQRLLKALDEIRKSEHKAMLRAGVVPLLKKMRWAFLKSPRRWTNKERRRMRELESANLATFAAKMLIEGFNHFWTFRSATWAGKFLDNWVAKVQRLRRAELGPLKKAARTLEKHRPYLLNFIHSKGLNSGVIEGLNRKLKTATNRSYGFRTDRALQVALYHELGRLPLPKTTHSFF